MFGYNRQSCQLWCNLWLCDKKKTWAVRKKSRVQSSGSTLDFQGYRHWSGSCEPIDKVSWHQWWTRGSTMSVSAVNVRLLQAGLSFSATRPSEQKQTGSRSQGSQRKPAPHPFLSSSVSPPPTTTTCRYEKSLAFPGYLYLLFLPCCGKIESIGSFLACFHPFNSILQDTWSPIVR